MWFNTLFLSWITFVPKKIRPCLIELLNNLFSIFKQHYTFFHTFFHPHIFQKTTNNITQTLLLNESKVISNMNKFSFENAKNTNMYLCFMVLSNQKKKIYHSLKIKIKKVTNCVNLIKTKVTKLPKFTWWASHSYLDILGVVFLFSSSSFSISLLLLFLSFFLFWI